MDLGPIDALALALGYLAGSIPFGLLLTRLAGLGDIRAVGSGNIGATNVLRTGRKSLAAATLLLDGAKGGLVALAFAFADASTTAPLIAGAAAVVGHDFPVWLRFKGGKGVATTLGVLLAVAWPVGLAFAAAWAGAAALFRISSLAALVALVVAPVAAWGLGNAPVAIMAAGLAILGAVCHRANIARLLRGDEPRIGRKSAT